jgi:hypothetical protein
MTLDERFIELDRRLPTVDMVGNACYKWYVVADTAHADRPSGSTAHRAGKRSRWLLLVHQLPTSPSRARVKTWRRLQQLGAVAIRNAVYVLPDSAQAREDFEWMKAEILANKGGASIFAADTIDSITDDEIVGAFRADRERSFEAIRTDARKLMRNGVRVGAMRGTNLRRLQRAVRQLRDRFTQVTASDLFGASGREETNTSLADLEGLVTVPATDVSDRSAHDDVLRPEDYRGRTWLTRPRPGIDRAGSAWLIRRFIDPAARFTFGERPQSGSSKSVPFDMYDVEFSHHGDRCTFEVLSERFGIEDAAVAQLGRLVHDLDLKETRYNMAEAATVGRLIDGLRQAYSRDEELLEHGIVLFEGLYRAFAGTRVPADAKPRVARRAKHRRKGR